MNEAQTKHELIEPALRQAGWGVVGKYGNYKERNHE